MNTIEVEIYLKSIGAIIEGDHFVGKGGSHFSSYFQKKILYKYPEETSHMCCIIAEAFINNDVEVVIGPETGGIIISRYTAMELSHLLDRNIPTTYANKSKDAKSFFITSDFIQMIAGKNVLVVEDNITTGGSVRQVVEAVRKAGGHVVGVGVLCKNKTITKKDLADVPKLFSIIERAVELYPPEKCPLCGLGIPVNTEHGHGKEFLENQKFTGKFKD